MLDFEHLTRPQHILLVLGGVVAAFVIFAADVALGLGLVVPLLYVGLLLGYYSARVERVYLAIGGLSAVLTLVGAALARGDGLTYAEALDRVAFTAVLTALAMVLSRALSYQGALRARSATDELTGVSQHGMFLDLITKESARARRYQNPLTLAVFEIDNLRELAAAHGRATRDGLLTSLAKACAEGLRPTDLLGRIDDRLVAGLPETREIDAAVVAERLRQAAFEHEDAREGGGTVSFGVTVGIAALSEDDEVSDVLERAGGAVRHAQASGGNRVSIAQAETAVVA
jgi:diguanylate cyclase (GGDEF)-like protein